MFILFKTAVLVAIGLAITQQAVNVLESRARVANKPAMEKTAPQQFANQQFR